MADPWLTIIGMGEDGVPGLSAASRAALEAAEVVTGSARLMGLLAEGGAASGAQHRVWPVPFEDGIEPLLALRGRRVVVLASGDPFWFGAGATLAPRLEPGEWRAIPGPSTFAHAAARLGWPLEETLCLGLHATPFERLTPSLAPGLRAILLLRDGAAPAALAAWLTGRGFGASELTVLEALGGPVERVRQATAAGFALDDIRHPVAVALEAAGGPALPCVSGLPDDAFAHDGQITKRPVRALTLSALAPRAGERLWDIGAGSGSISIEWLLSAPRSKAVAIERDPARAARIRENGAHYGLSALEAVEGKAPDALDCLETEPDAVFIGGGLSQSLLEALWRRLRSGTRVVANAVTLESEALLAHWQAETGGTLLRIELSEAAPLGARRGWRASYPVVQWSTVR
ncbi:MAG: precorrin-6y C5,15-methyltransferase (decarboxylating) subunit CbiE [Pseudomonadota bacterium]